MKKLKTLSFSEEEVETLLRLNKHIGLVKDKVDLLQILNDEIKSIIPFDSPGLFIVNEEENYHYDLTVLYPEINNDVWNTALSTNTIARIPHRGTAIEEVLRYSKARLWHLKEDLLDKGFEHPYFPLMLERKIFYAISCPIIIESKVLGFFSLSSINPIYAEAQLELFTAITDIVAISVNNILSRETLVKENEIKQVLLDISGSIAAIHDRKELFATIIKSIKPLIPMDDTAILVLNEDGSKWKDWTNLDNYQETVTVLTLKEQGFDHWQEMDEITEKSFRETGILSIDEYIKTNHVFAPIMHQTGLKEFMFTPLINRGKVVGSLFFDSLEYNTYSPNAFNLFKTVSDMIALAVANILANEEIIERENEKTKLLEITELIAFVKSTPDLLKIIIEKIKPLFNFHDCGLFVVNEDGNTHSDWAALLPDVSPSDWNEKIASVSCNIEHKNSLVEWMIEEMKIFNKPLLFDFVNLVKDFPNYPQLDGTGVLEMGYRDCLATNLTARGKIIGFFCINALEKDFFKPSQFELFQSVTHSISIAVANIIANDKILDRENEKSKLLEITKEQTDKKILELDLAKILAQTLPWEDKLLEVGKMLQPFISFQLLLISFEKNDNKCPVFAFFRTGFNEYQKLKKDDMLHITNMDAETFLRIRSNQIKVYEHPFILSGNSLKEHNKNNEIKDKICWHFNFKSNLIYPIKLDKYGKIIFSFYGNEETNFTEEHIQFFECLESTLQLVFDRSLGLEEIERLNNQLTAQNKYLKEEIKTEFNFDTIIGNSRLLQEVFKNVEMVSSTDTTVLILGETGTGKELIARSLHNSSSRKSNVFIKINCAALPAQLIESELFGHEKGSFTGAFERRIGKFELADDGSIFLDEIGELPLELQAKLLRVIQEKEFERIGGKQTIKCDVRIIAATNRVLEDEVKKGHFRADLYYRLNVFPITLPPLRERKEDISLLATHFAQKYSKKMNKHFKGINSTMLDALYEYNWPGNIRELENVIEQAVIVNQDYQSLELARKLFFVEQPTNSSLDQISLSNFKNNLPKSITVIKEEKEAYERKLIIDTLQKTKGRVRGKKGAALLLDILPTTLESKMKRYGIFKDEFDRL